LSERNHALDLLRARRSHARDLLHLFNARDYFARRAFSRVLAESRHPHCDVGAFVLRVRLTLSKENWVTKSPVEIARAAHRIATLWPGRRALDRIGDSMAVYDPDAGEKHLRCGHIIHGGAKASG
ncbi:MAG: hypothetical protein JWO45_356, partial [Spartobacteria bacterium]|nr:hypothetical protein [Spartobacteria bacterium]